MSVEPGWYHAQGDPEGTVRRWNGTEWVGFPITEPGAASAPAASSATFAPVRGQVSLTVTAVIAQLALLILILAQLALAYSYVRLAQTTTGIDDISDDLTNQLGVANLLIVLATVLAAVAFIVWFSLAYRNIGLWAQTRRSSMWSVLAWIIPFINLIRPMSMMLELVEKSPRPDRRGELSPTPVIVWWLLWMLPSVAGAILAVNIARRDIDDIAKGIFAIQAGVTVLNAASVAVAIYLVQGITDSQERWRAT